MNEDEIEALLGGPEPSEVRVAMASGDARETRLPAWVRHRITVLRARVRELEADVKWKEHVAVAALRSLPVEEGN